MTDFKTVEDNAGIPILPQAESSSGHSPNPATPLHAAASTALSSLSTKDAQPPAIPDHELMRVIGEGAYGEVWLAHNAVGTLRAVKIVRCNRHDSAESFDREFKGLQKFEPISRAHEGLVDILTLGLLPDGAGFYYVMELADAANVGQASSLSAAKGNSNSGEAGKMPALLYAPRTLRADLKSHGALPADEVITLGLKLTAALAHLHAQGLVHRDVKPTNIIFVSDEPKLADAGLVAAVDDARSLVGTAGYIAPEGPGTPQADLYALGKVLYEAVFGKDRQEFPALPADVASRPDHARLLELNAILLKACATDRCERYQSADEMRADLELLHAGRSVKRRRTRQKARRFSIRLGAAAAVIIAACFLFNRFNDSPVQRSAASPPVASIFVLLFRNDGTNQADEVLRSRITDALIDGLALIEGVKVGPRRIGLLQRGEEEARRQALKEFNARHTLAGTVRTSGDQVSIALGFHESAQNRLLWAESFEDALTNLAVIELRVVRRIAMSLGTPLRPEREQEVSAKLSRNQSAYELYQRAFRFMETQGTDYNARAQMFEYLNRALDLDENFAQAHTALALVHRMALLSDRSPREAMTEVRKCALRAIEIDPSFAEGHYWLGAFKGGYEYDWKGYDDELRRAFELAPGQHDAKALALRCHGRIDAARAEQEKAMQQSPPWGQVPDESLWQFLLEEQFDRALELCRDMVRKEPNELAWLMCFGQCYRRMGRYEDALEQLEKARPRWNPPILLAEIGMVYALMGRRGDALAILQKMDEQTANRYTSPYFKAQIHAALDDKEQALDELENAYVDGCEQLVNVDFSWGLRTDPSWKGMTSEPRFVALLKKVGLDVWPN
ncbi:MAG: protein kinase [Verrucomicrobia bacterium]|nr:protein kinase [Verrucomicrobiota bacterium]